ncbi:MAG: Plug domain-containing protein [Gemmatimonadota bacterium]|nr:Plug domain-containing protein [Gemmatimonadota bacterium]MDH5804224.1 Plug domain-containing protein [Gemmatimonadota bacterium]
MKLNLPVGPVFCTILLLASCKPGTHEETAPIEGHLVSREEIAELGNITVWQAIRRLTNLTLEDTPSGRPNRLVHRGQGSILLRDAPLIFIDGNRLEDFRVLADIPAQEVHSILVLSGAEATIRYGTNAHGGVIVISMIS